MCCLVFLPASSLSLENSMTVLGKFAGFTHSVYSVAKIALMSMPGDIALASL